MTEQVVREIELEINQARDMIKRKEMLDRLYANSDFQEVIGKGYFEQEAIRLVHLKGDPAMQAEKDQTAILKEMDGIGSLKGYFSAVVYQAQMAVDAIEERQNFLTEMASEEEGE